MPEVRAVCARPPRSAAAHPLARGARSVGALAAARLGRGRYQRRRALDRNYLRRRCCPLIRERWPGAARAVARSARHVAEASACSKHWRSRIVERAADGRRSFVTASACAGAGPPPQRRAFLDRARRASECRDAARLDGDRRPAARRPRRRQPGSALERRVLRRQRQAPRTSKRSPQNRRREPRNATKSWNWRSANSIAQRAGGLARSSSTIRRARSISTRCPRRSSCAPRRGGERLRPESPARPRRRSRRCCRTRRVPSTSARDLPLVFAGRAA